MQFYFFKNILTTPAPKSLAINVLDTALALLHTKVRFKLHWFYAQYCLFCAVFYKVWKTLHTFIQFVHFNFNEIILL